MTQTQTTCKAQILTSNQYEVNDIVPILSQNAFLYPTPQRQYALGHIFTYKITIYVSLLMLWVANTMFTPCKG